MALFVDPKLYGLETMTLDEQIAHLTRLCEYERTRGLLKHWTYEVARHREYYALLRDAIAKRDIEKIDQAFERAAERMEAAE